MEVELRYMRESKTNGGEWCEDGECSGVEEVVEVDAATAVTAVPDHQDQAGEHPECLHDELVGTLPSRLQ